MKKIITGILAILMFTTCICSYSFAATKAETTMKVVEEPICTIKLGEYGLFEKKLIGFDEAKKQVTIQLKVTNTAKKVEEKEPGDVVILLDNSGSMEGTPINGGLSLKDSVYDSAKILAQKIYARKADAKVGVIDFATAEKNVTDEEPADTNFEGVDSESRFIKGSLDDAQVLTELTSDIDEVTAALDKFKNTKNYVLTNLEAGLEKASQVLEKSTNSKKYVVVLSDGVPNVTIGNVTPNHTQESFVDIYNNAVTPTSEKIQELKEDGIEVIAVSINLHPEGYIKNPDKTFSEVSYRDIAEKIFGTNESPKVSSVYYIDDTDVENTITNTVFQDVAGSEEHTLTNIKIVDYFPKEIIDNFDFSYNKSPNIGKVSAQVDKQTNSITWEIEVLKPEEVATLSYNLTLKENYDSSIIGKVLPTNTKVDATYTLDDVTDTKTSDVTPKVILDVVAQKKIPQTGVVDGLYIGISAAIVILVCTVSVIYIRKNKDLK